jgi:hypothetical protein
MTYPQTYPQAWQGNKVTERKKTEFRSLGKTAENGNGTEHTPLGVFRSSLPMRQDSMTNHFKKWEKVIHRRMQ